MENLNKLCAQWSIEEEEGGTKRIIDDWDCCIINMQLETIKEDGENARKVFYLPDLKMTVDLENMTVENANKEIKKLVK